MLLQATSILSFPLQGSPIQRVFLAILTLLLVGWNGPFISGQQTISNYLEEKEEFTIPFELREDFMLVHLKMEGKIDLTLIFDTGASNTILFDRIYTDIFEIPFDMRIPIIGSDLSTEQYAFVARNVSFEFPDKISTSLDILVLEEYTGRLRQYLGTQIDGILGASFFRFFSMEIDYRREEIILRRKTPEKIQSEYDRHPLQMSNGKPYMECPVRFRERKDSSNLLLLIDSGSAINLLIHTNTDTSLRMPEKTLPGELGVGIGGILLGYIGRLHQFSFGNSTYGDILTTFQDIDSAALSEDQILRNGLIGTPLLRRYSIVIDYPRQQLFLRARKGNLRPFKFDRSGLSIIATGPKLNQYYIHSVRPNSPAAEVGLQAGDRIVKLQCWPMFFYSLPGINDLMKKKEGKKIRIKVERGDEKLKFSFRLRKLI